MTNNSFAKLYYTYSYGVSCLMHVSILCKFKALCELILNVVMDWFLHLQQDQLFCMMDKTP